MPALRKLSALGSIALVCALAGMLPTVAGAGSQEPTGTAPDPLAEPAPPAHQRLWLAAPRRSAAGRRIEIAVRRRERDGRYDVAQLCVAPPALGWSCRRLVLRDGVRRVTPGFRVAAPGRWLFRIRNHGQRLREATRVAPRGGRLKVLATGDSMTQIFDHYLADGLGAAAVRSEAHISTGLSKPSMLDWVANARSQAARVKPDVTVVFIGANDGFPMPTPSGATAPCCDGAWVDEYARRAAQMMRSYRRGSAGRVYWLTLPAPRGGSFRTVFGPVNAAIRKAARRVRGVHVVPIDRIFTPRFVYRDSIVWGGRSVHVRQGDGVHLNNAGASIAAQKTIARMRANRIL